MRTSPWVGTHAAEIVLFAFSLGLLSFGLYIVGPWFLSFLGTVSPVAAVSERGAQIAIGAFFCVSALLGLSLPFWRKHRLRMAKYSAILCFISFSFLAFLRIAVFGWLPLTWIYPVLVAFASGVTRLYLESRDP